MLCDCVLLNRNFVESLKWFLCWGLLCVVQARDNCTCVHCAAAAVVCGCEAECIAQKCAAEAKRHISSVSLIVSCFIVK